MTHVKLSKCYNKETGRADKEHRSRWKYFKEGDWGRLPGRGGLRGTGLLCAQKKQPSQKLKAWLPCDPVLLGFELLWRSVCLGVLKPFYRLGQSTRPTHGRSSVIGYGRKVVRRKMKKAGPDG